MSTVKSNFLWNSAYQVVRIIIPIILTPYITRVLGSEQLGIFSYASTIANYAVLFIILGLNQYGNREIAKSKNDKQLMTRTFWSIYATQVVAGLIVTCVYVLYLATLTGTLADCSWIFLINIVSEIFDFAWLFYGLEEFRVITIRNVVVRVASVAAIFLFVKTQNDITTYCLITALTVVVNNCIFLAMLPARISGFYRPNVNEIVSHVKPNLTLFAPMIAISLYTQLNNLFLGTWSSMNEVAFYASSYSVVTVPLAIIQSLGTVLLPRLSAILKDDDEAAAQAYVSTSMWISMLMCCGFVSGIFSVAQLFVPTYYGPGYDECIVILPVLCTMIIPCSVSSVTGNQYLLPHEKDSVYLKSVIAGAIANVCLCFLMIPNYGALGAAISTVISEFVVAIYQIASIRESLPFKKFFLDCIPFIASGLIEFLAIKAVSFLEVSNIVLLCLEILIGIIAYCLSCALFLILKKDQTFLSLIKQNRQ